MKQTWTYVAATAAICVLTLASTGCEKLRARDELNKGVQSFKGARYPEAVTHFKTAVDLDPTFPAARLYLATAYMSQWIPGANSPDNNKMAQEAKDQFNKVLEAEPGNTMAIASIASLEYNQAKAVDGVDNKIKQMEEAKKWYEKLVSTDPKSKEGYYSLGVITWEEWYPAYVMARQKAGMKMEEPGPIKKKEIRDELREKYGKSLQYGLDNLNKALEIDPDYDDAMAYENLIIRQRADLADSPDVYAKDTATADQWVQKALETKRKKAEAAAKGPGGIVVDKNK